MECKVLGGQCPRFFDSNDKKFCCLGDDGEQSCCSGSDFMQTTVVVASLLSLIVFLLCCICCCCCRKGQRGVVYGPGPRTIVQVTQNPPSGSGYGNNYMQTAYPTQEMPQSPPSYSVAEPYSKQSPYNPNYPNV